MAAALPAAVAQLAGCSFSGLVDEDLLEVLRLAEQARRQLEALDHLLIAEVEARNLPGRHVLRGSKQLLSGLLNLSPAESSARVRHAHQLGPRISLTGERLGPLLPATATARAAGSITARQAEVIMQAMARLRDAQLPVEQQADAEAFLVEQAHCFDAGTLTGIARQLLDTLDPDGSLAAERSQQRRRFLSCHPNGDGMHRLTADLDTETAALAMTVLHSLAAPKPSEAGERDQRTAGQRMHDALRAVLKLALRAGELPTSGGVPATVLITMTAEQFQTGTGLASTSYQQRLTVDQALRVADQATIAWIVHNSKGGILNYGTTRRVATDKQTLALIARDKGRAFPGCADPTRVDRETSHHAVGGWRRHRSGQPLPALRLSPRPHRHRRLADHHARRAALVHPTGLDRPATTTTTQHPTLTAKPGPDSRDR
ncbi:MAG: DUF222 domain-containing protein [Jatrophihabitantaceae bacterium]